MLKFFFNEETPAEIAKNFAVGLLSMAAIAAFMFGLVQLVLFLEFTKQTAGYVVMVLPMMYLTYIFGGLTRSIFSKK